MHALHHAWQIFTTAASESSGCAVSLRDSQSCMGNTAYVKFHLWKIFSLLLPFPKHKIPHCKNNAKTMA